MLGLWVGGCFGLKDEGTVLARKGDINMGLMLLTYVLAAVAFGWYGVFFGPIILVAFTNFAREVFPVLLDKEATLRN